MPNIQVRNLGQYGAVPDASPWDLPIMHLMLQSMLGLMKTNLKGLFHLNL